MKSTKKILGASAALGLAVALSAGSTFAWFASTGRTTAKVENITLNVTTTVEGNETLDIVVPTFETSIGADGGVGYDTIFKSSQSGAGVVITDQLQPLTLVETQQSGEGTGKYVLKTQANMGKVTEDTEDGGYYVFTIGFASKKESPMTVYLDATEESGARKSSVASSGSATPQDINLLEIKADAAGRFVDTSATPAKGSDTYGDKDSIVVSILDGSTPTPGAVIPTIGANGYYQVDVYADDDEVEREHGTASATLNARAANASRLMFQELKTTGNQRVWSPNEAEYSGKEVSATPTVVNNPQGFWKNNLARDYVALTEALALNKEFAAKDFPAKITGTNDQADYTALQLIPYIYNSTTSNDNLPSDTETEGKATPIAVLDTIDKISGNIYFNGNTTKTPAEFVNQVSSNEDYVYSFINVKVWIEGTDGDCFDSILGDSITINLSFKGVPSDTPANNVG